MMVREGGGARQVEEKGADNAAEPLEDLLKAAAEDAAANPRLYHGTTLDAGDDKEHGFSLENASPQGDLGEIRMVYFSKVSRFAAAWAILKTHPLSWDKRGQVDKITLSIVSVAKPELPDGPPCSLPYNATTFKWLKSNQAKVKNRKLDQDGHLTRARIPLDDGEIVSHYAWIEGPLSPESINAWKYSHVANMTGLGNIAQNSPGEMRQWGFTKIGMHLISPKKLTHHVLVVCDPR